MYNFNEDDKKIIRGIRAVVKERGEGWTYPKRKPENKDWYEGFDHENGMCVNLLPDGKGACIVGAIACDQDMYILRGTPVNEFTRIHNLSGPVHSALRYAQNRQDSGYLWGEVLEAFEGELKIVGVTI